jgi:hypothetical protein
MKSILRSRSYIIIKIRDCRKHEQTTEHGRLERPAHDQMFINRNRAAYLFLEAEGDAADGALLDALHEVGGVAGNLVSQSLGLDDGDVVNDSLIYMEVVREPTQHTHGEHMPALATETRRTGRRLNAITYLP